MNTAEAFTSYRDCAPGRPWSDELVSRHAPLVKRIAHHLKGRLPPTVQIEDLIQAGMIGLLEAARKFDDDQGAAFETYAGIRIRGAMIDEVRKHDWTPRSVHRKARQVAEAIRTVENREGRDAFDHEVAAELGMTLEEYHHILCDATTHRLLSFDEMGHEDEPVLNRLPDRSPGIIDHLQQEDLRDLLVEVIDGLSERERTVLALYYDEELNLKEIGAVLGVTESRICQIHGQALIRLRTRLAEEWTGPGSC